MNKPCDDNETSMRRVFDALAKFMFLTEQSCRKKNLDYNEDAVRELLTQSKPWLDYASTGTGEKPIVFRLNRNLGYITGNLFVGTPSDKQRFAELHAKQRAEPNATRAQRASVAPLGQFGIDYGQARKLADDQKLTTKHAQIEPPKAGDAISNHIVTKREARLYRNKFARQQTDAATAAALAKPTDALSPNDKRLRKNAAQKRWRQKRARTLAQTDPDQM